MTAEVSETPNEHRWTLRGHRITQLTVDLGSFRLLTWTLEASAEVRLAVPFTFREPDAIERIIDPDEPERLSPLLSLLGRTIDVLVATRRGELMLAFGDGSSLRVLPHPRFEAWEVQGGGALEGMSYLCAPGGGPPW
jgi:uncharacterized protein DUF6188